jgi:hypothetical protein
MPEEMEGRVVEAGAHPLIIRYKQTELVEQVAAALWSTLLLVKLDKKG